VLELILDVRSRGIPIILISHNMPHVFEVADRIHVHRLGKRLCVINPKDYTMSDAVAFMTGAKEPPQDRGLKRPGCSRSSATPPNWPKPQSCVRLTGNGSSSR
jgi:ABC-type sugar transport system ATPase subunit